MALRTAAAYQSSLRDGRSVYFRGERIPDVTAHPVLATAVKHASIDYQLADDPAYRDLAVVRDPATGAEYSRYFHIPRTADDLLQRSALIEASTRIGATLVVLIKEIGTDALFALHIVAKQMDDQLHTSYLDRVRRFYQYCRENDLAMSVAQTDVKGDRSRGPSEQAHPDYYVRVVSQNAEGIVVRGAKAHTSCAPNVNEIVVLPTRQMGEQDRDYAVAFAVPANSKGVELIVSPFGTAGPKNAFENPISGGHKMLETVTVFDDVFVPWERVFMCGEHRFAGSLARTFVEYHRFTAISYKLPLVDLLVGGALLMAEYNGIERAAHVREKITSLISYAETLRALTKMAANQCRVVDPDIAVPDTMLVNIAKLHFASNYHQAVGCLQDLTGGLTVTGPALEDLRNPATNRYIERYLGGKEGVSAEARLRAINMVKDLSASDYGGYQEVLAIHAEGSLEAERMTILREYRADSALAYARWVAGIEETR